MSVYYRAEKDSARFVIVVGNLSQEGWGISLPLWGYLLASASERFRVQGSILCSCTFAVRPSWPVKWGGWPESASDAASARSRLGAAAWCVFDVWWVALGRRTAP